MKLFRRLFAFWWNNYYEHVTHRVFGKKKKKLLSTITGNVVEIGPGSGRNICYLPKNIKSYTGIEPSRPMIERFYKKNFGAPFRVIEGTSEHIPLKDGSVDVVISTHVLCSVGDVKQTLREIKRVLKLGGRFIFIEHVAAEKGSFLGMIQCFVGPLWLLFGDGCHTHRTLGKEILEAGFKKVDLVSEMHPDFGYVVSPHIIGTAIR